MRKMLLLLFLCFSGSAVAGNFPKEKLPEYITPLTDIGQRAEWSHDGKTVMFLTKAGGAVQEVDVRTREIREVSSWLEMPRDWGFYRALYLSNGDYLFTAGPRRREAYLVIANKDLSKRKIFYQIIYEGHQIKDRLYPRTRDHLASRHRLPERGALSD